MKIIILKMKKIFVIVLLVFFKLQLTAQTHKLAFSTSKGTFKVVLYDFTPKHKQLILNAVMDSVYKDAFFNRIIKNFVVQGGEHDESIAEREKNIDLNKRQRLQPEFNNRAFHKLGALGAGRDENIEKASFLNQIYFVVGKPVSKTELKKIEQKKGVKFTKLQRKTYLKKGGLPRLDGDYTVFGEVYQGLDVLLELSKVATDKNDYPLQEIKFNVKEIFEKAPVLFND